MRKKEGAVGKILEMPEVAVAEGEEVPQVVRQAVQLEGQLLDLLLFLLIL
jgi:hypothetical protein